MKCCWCAAVVPALAAAALLSAAEPAMTAQVRLPRAGIDADPKIPTLKQVVGHDWGRDISSHMDVERYLKALAGAAPDRAALVLYGRSWEGRALYYLILSSPENIRRREEIRANNLRLADPRITPAEKVLSMVAQAPAIVWLAFGVHGNETSSTEAALLTAYDLLADRRRETQEMLSRVLLILDPLQNPDGHERFVNGYREARGAFPDAQPLAAEHQERWPSGRSNHYLFDMNRDWFQQSQRETRARVAAYLRWQPHLFVDAHEMGRDATYFFDPPADPINPFFLPRQVEWLDRIGHHLAARFDECGFAYTSREMFDSFYPGYASSWPLFQGGLGILWEQASARGLVIQREDERQLHLQDAVLHHYTSALATLDLVARQREQLVRDFCEARLRGIQLGREGPVRHFFLPPDPRSARVASLARLLRNNGIEVRRLTKTLKIPCTSVRSAAKAKMTIPAGSYHIPVAQPAAPLVRVLLDRHVDMGQEFVQRQLERNKERFPDEIYDVTAWSLPLAFGVNCLATGEAVEVPGESWDGSPAEGRIVGGTAKVAYLIPDHDSAIPALASWLRAGVRVRVADRPFSIGENEFPRGTLILRTSENSAALHPLMERSAKQYGLRIVASHTGMVTEGAHPGGPHVRWVRPPKVALVMDRPTSYSVGHTWYLFDEVLRYPTTRISAESLARLPWQSYNVLVLPDGDYGDQPPFGDKEAARIRQWVADGGTLILVKNAAVWGARKNIGLLSAEVRKKPPEAKVPDSKAPSAPAGEPPAEPLDPVPGAFLRAKVFEEHWITFGCSETIDVMFNGNVVLAPPAPSQGRSLVTFLPKADVLASGFCWPQTLDALAGSAYLLHQPLGQGHVVAFADDPNFRAMYPSIQRLFVNAVMFGPGH